MPALGSLPEWLRINPGDYLRATQAGAQLGTQIAENSQRAWEAQQRMRMEAEAQNAKLQQFALEQAAQRLAADRLEQYRQAEIENRKGELGIQERKLGSLDIAQQRADDLARHQMAMEDAAAKRAEQAGQGKMYGEPVYADIPGLPGVKAAYRPGSPGLHIVVPPKAAGEMTRNQAAALLEKIPSLSELDPSITNEVSSLRNIAFPKSSNRFRYNKATGKIESIGALPKIPTNAVDSSTDEGE